MSNKKKLQQFAEIKTFKNVTEVGHEDALNKFHPIRGNWKKEIFKNDNDIVLELGCGKGEYSVGMGRIYPDKNFIGMDIKGARMWRGAKTALEEKITNVHFLRSRIDFLTSFFAPNEVNEIWLTFPDPQPQLKRERKRLTSDRFLDKYFDILVKKGKFHLKTDSDFLYNYSLELAQSRNENIEISTAQLYSDLDKLDLDKTEKEVLNIKTHYEKMFVDKGHKISYLRISNEH